MKYLIHYDDVNSPNIILDSIHENIDYHGLMEIAKKVNPGKHIASISSLSNTSKIYKCSLCGQPELYQLDGDPGEDLVCSDCEYWLNGIEYMRNGDRTSTGQQVIRTNGTQYIVGKNDDEMPMKGFSGREFVFKMLTDGSIVKTSNLWYNGDIPDRFKEDLPDNAIQIY